MEKKKGKLVEKKMTFQERKPQAEKWVANFKDCGNKNIIKCYCKRFAVDRLKAVDELQYMGIKLTKEQIEKERKVAKTHQKSLMNKKRNKKRKKLGVQNQLFDNTDQDDTFYYIAGYTCGEHLMV